MDEKRDPKSDLIRRLRRRENLTTGISSLTNLADVLAAFDDEDQTPAVRRAALELFRKTKELREGVERFLRKKARP